VLAVNDAGLISNKLTVQQSHDTGQVAGTYGVFHQGNVKSIFKNASGTTVAVATAMRCRLPIRLLLKTRLKWRQRGKIAVGALFGRRRVYRNLDSIAVTPVADIETIHKEERADNKALAIIHKGNILSIDVRFEGPYS